MKSRIKKAASALKSSLPEARSSSYRPQYHFSPPANWMNDPNGTIYVNGEYHLFYQHNPYNARWGRIHWGHARSRDLVRWEHLPIALAPDPGLKELHCFSGCCVIRDDGIPVVFYTNVSAISFLTAVRRFTQQWAAVGTPDLLVWEKHPDNPILDESIHPAGRMPRNWRDPYVWKSELGWYMITAGQFKGEKFGSVLLYQSPNLMEWVYLGRLYQGDERQGKTWECPNYFQLGEKYVLVVSPFNRVIYSIGEFIGHEHVSEGWFTFDHGMDFYATNTYTVGKDRVIVVGWIKAKDDGLWAGCLSIPRVLNLDGGNQLWIQPLPELESLRHKHTRYERKLDTAIEFAGTGPYFGESVEIKAEYDLQAAKSVGFRLIDDEDEHLIQYNFLSQTFRVFEKSAQLQFPAPPGRLTLHIFVDRSVVEIFINARETFTAVFYPKLGEHHTLKISPFVTGVRGGFSIDFWTLEGMNEIGMNSEV
jgi:beta-fructofuranosidase